MRYFVTIDGAEHVVEVAELPGGRHEVRLLESADGDSSTARVLPARFSHTGHALTLQLGDRVFDVVLEGELPSVGAWVSGRRARVEIESARMRAAQDLRSARSEGHDGTVTSPMPGKVIKVLVAEGDEVAVGAPVVVVEAMKMENELGAPCAGVVKKVYVQPGDAVEGGARLVTVG
jgi:biotin carboxyl carrier protein